MVERSGSYYSTHHPFPHDQVEAGGLNPDLAPAPIRIGESIGGVTAAASEETSLPGGLMVVAGVNDGVETSIGAGLTKAGRAVDSGGTAGGFGMCWHEPLEVSGVYGGPGIIPGQTFLGGSMNALGKSVDWYLETFEDASMTHEALIACAATVPPVPRGLFFCPIWLGSAHR